MIDLLLEWAGDPAQDEQFQQQLAEHISALAASAGAGDRSQVAKIEAAVNADPTGSFDFDARGWSTLRTTVGTFPAGHFETPSVADLRQRALASPAAGVPGRVRLWVLLGASRATDIGALQATAGPGTLFQVASQFNCLEAPGPYITPIADYFRDSTQGPRSAISAFPGTFLRHYAAPAADGRHFVQTPDGAQIDLLEAVCPPGVARVRNGYLTASEVADPSAFAAALEDRFEQIRVGVHADVPVVLGYDWDGGVTGDRRIDQVFTSAFAGGVYGGPAGNRAIYRPICRALLRAAYLGTLLAAAALGRTKVVLTLIGGGAFRNPVPLIWDSILWAVEEVDRMGFAMDVIVNSRNLGVHVPLEKVLSAVRSRAGAVVELGAGVSLWR